MPYCRPRQPESWLLYGPCPVERTPGILGGERFHPPRGQTDDEVKS